MCNIPKVGRSKPGLVLTDNFNLIEPPKSILQEWLLLVN